MGGYPSVLVGSVSVCHFKINEQTYSRPRLRESTYHLGQKKIDSIRSNLKTNSQQEILINDKQSRVLVCDQMEEFLPVSTTELKTIISSMNNKNCLLDPAPVKLMRQCPQVIFPLIQFIINKSFKESHAPF